MHYKNPDSVTFILAKSEFTVPCVYVWCVCEW